MSRNGNSPSSSLYSILKDLCHHMCKDLDPVCSDKVYREAVAKVVALDESGNITAAHQIDDGELCQKIESQLEKLGKFNECQQFRKLFRRLKSGSTYQLLNNYDAVLSFLLGVSQETNRDLTNNPSVRKSVPIQKDFSFGSANEIMGDQSEHPSLSELRTSSFDNKAVRPSSLTKFSLSVQRSASGPSVSKDMFSTASFKDKRLKSSDSLSLLSATGYRPVKTIVSEATVLKELVYSFQGIPGNILKPDLQGGFTINPQVRVKHASLVEKLAELGYLHNRVVSSSKSLAKAGSVGQAVESAVQRILSDYHGFVARVHSMLLADIQGDPDSPMFEESIDCTRGNVTLRKLDLWARSPISILQCLCDCLEAISNARGGKIIGSLDHLRHHGDPKYSNVVHILLENAGKPMIQMIRRWLIHGELFDPYDEFFIGINSGCHDRDIWRDKFVLRKDLIPNTTSRKLAEMILRSGKAVHFLNVICDERLPITGSRQKLEVMEDLDLIHLMDPRSDFSQVIFGIFEETSKTVLETLINKFKLFQLFQGLRRYILLGQGDFANCFMELIEPEMRKPANQLCYHELVAILGNAVRLSTAVREDQEIIKRVTIKLLIASDGDLGFDVFGLHYVMHESLDAALRLSEGAYSHMFNFLWRTKRMEFILLTLRKERWALKNTFNILSKKIPDISTVLALADRISIELVHFAREFHFYILFEVVECHWEKFSTAFQKAKSFDDVISAHNIFMNDLQKQTFQDPKSRKFISDLRQIWDIVFELEDVQNKFFTRLEEEMADISNTNLDESTRLENNKKFKIFLGSIRAHYSIITRNYQEVLKKFLLELSTSKDHMLLMLSSRLDYNDYYKRTDARILDSMKFSRCSDLFE